ncbi:type IV pilus modification PilV family protein [Paraburkholderia elongata]|uniref:Uncharacterized protein n=1 Tax=Paraburkholderia elongata TaxID=2675747 RepID=A0A972P118_9BURK|nr:prepilin-type N-terminal cleavage/methylation domain-containing protein [Paraburkholderia elongata]NPT61190.1 hypothetical protein [Paraburkholderia elongata]
MRSTRHRGSSLIEVMLAVTLMAVTALGLIAGQLWTARATALLPHGEASVGESSGVSAARVTWTALRDMPRADDVIDKPESCGGADVPAGSSCVALAFAK